MRGVENEDLSVRQITNVILKDYGLTVKVLRTANSVRYNRSGRAIHSVTHAVALLGLEAIRDLATSLLLFEHYQRTSPSLKQLMLLSLLTANHAREISLRVGYPRCEEAYLCGMFHNLGEVLVSCYFAKAYAEILFLVREKGLTNAEATAHVLGFRYEELGEAMARQWRMGERVARSVRAVEVSHQCAVRMSHRMACSAAATAAWVFSAHY